MDGRGGPRWATTCGGGGPTLQPCDSLTWSPTLWAMTAAPSSSSVSLSGRIRRATCGQDAASAAFQGRREGAPRPSRPQRPRPSAHPHLG